MPAKKGQHEYTFSKKTGMSLDKAKQSFKEQQEKPLSNNKRRAMSTFVQKLYRDEDELNDLKVLAGEGNFDSDLEEKGELGEGQTTGAKVKRGAKQAAKMDGRKIVQTTTKVGKLVSVSYRRLRS